MDTSNNNAQLEQKWFVLKDTRRFGPFNYGEMVHMMQSKSLFDFDYIWSQGMKGWTILGDVPQFSTEQLKNFYLVQSKSPSFLQRKSPRVALTVPLFIHNNATLWTGKTLSLSEGGALVTMGNPLLIPGNVININFKKLQSEDVSFNTAAEVLTKKYTRERIQYDTKVTYAVKFIRKDPTADSQLKKWISNELSAA